VVGKPRRNTGGEVSRESDAIGKMHALK